MNQFNYNTLIVRHDRGKPIPYHAVDRGEDGANHGFIPLKGRPEDEIRSIAEAKDLPVLQDALVRLNAPESIYFTIGCEKSLYNVEGENNWARGYLEFALNNPQLASDASHYFPLFFNFGEHLQKSGLAREYEEKIRFVWELEGASFTEKSCGGFTCCVWITVGLWKGKEEVAELWQRGFKTLVDFMLDFHPVVDPQMPLIYELPKAD